MSMAVGLAAIIMVVLFAQTAGILPAPQAAFGGGIMHYGIKMALLVLFLAGCGLIGLLLVVARFERYYRYPVKLNSKNIEVQYALAKIMLSALQLICAVYICVMMAGLYKAVILPESQTSAAITAMALAAGGGVYAAYLAAAFKNR